MIWASPEYFFLFIPWALLAGWLVWARQRGRPSLQFSGTAGFTKIRPTWRMRLMWLVPVLKMLALALVILALARPQQANSRIKKNIEGIDIMIAFDISDSMLIEDMQPINRLESAKKTIEAFIKGRVSDRIGLVVFSGEAYTQVPLTLDYEVLEKSLRTVKASRNMKMGTAIGVALANSVGRLRESTAKTRVVILMTDGENNSGTIDPDTALQIAKGYGIKVYTIGMGKDGDAQLPVYMQDAFGNTIKRYQPIHSKINEELLSNLANTTGGKFFRAVTTNALEGVFKEINGLEKSKIDISKHTRYAELFATFLQWAIWFYLASYLLGRTWLQRMP